MKWKLKDEYIGHNIPNFKRTLCSLKAHHLEALEEYNPAILDIYFDRVDEKKTAKKPKIKGAGDE